MKTIRNTPMQLTTNKLKSGGEFMPKLPKIRSVALAVSLLLAGAGVATQAAEPNLTFSSRDDAQSLRGMTESPLAYTSFASRLDSQVAELKLSLKSAAIAADGTSVVDAELTVLDANGKPVNVHQLVSLEVSGGARILLEGETANDADIGKMDANRTQPAQQGKVKDGKLQFKVLAPMQAGDLILRASVGGRSVMAEVAALPAEHEMFAVGMVEVQVRGYKDSPLLLQRAKEGDGYEQEITNWRKEFGNGDKGRVNARSALYMKGLISGKTLLTLSYDTDKDKNGRLFQDIDPDAMYPIYGDSSTRGIDGQSTSKLYVRLDKGRSNLLYGDYITSSNDFNLANYNRSLTGAKAHYEEGAVKANAWVAYGVTSQVVDEIRGAGMSGPYSVSSPNGIKGSEKVELIVRDRFQPGVILQTTTLMRFSDYEFEVFNGRLLFRSPVPSVDSNNNPVSIRITYEVDSGGQRYATAGADAVVRINQAIAVGASIAKDNNPDAEYRVLGVMGEAKVSDAMRLKAELAQSKGRPSVGQGIVPANLADEGNAISLEASYEIDSLRVRATASKADIGFHNNNAIVSEGRTEAGVQVAYRMTPSLALSADLRHSKSDIDKTKANGVELAADYAVSDKLTVGGGVRQAKQDTGSLVLAGTTCNAAGSYTGSIDGYNGAGFGLNPNAGQVLNPNTGMGVACATGLPANAVAGSSVSSTGVFARAKYDVSDKFSVLGEVQSDKATTAGSSNTTATYALGAEYRPYDLTRIYLRHEQVRGLAGLYGLGVGDKSNLTTLGVDTEYMRDGHVFSEYRLRNEANGREVQHAIGLRNGFNIAEGVRLLTNAELVNAKATTINTNSGAATIAANTTKALGLGLEYTPNNLFKASGRVEWRDDSTATNYLTTVGVAAKVNQDWSLMARQYTNTVNYDAGGSAKQARWQVGSAYRPVDNNRFDALAMVELRRERNDSTNAASSMVYPKKDVNIMSMHFNYHPVRPWWVSGRLAYKQVNEILPMGIADKWTGTLLGARVKYDATNRWTVGLNLNTLVSSYEGRRNQYAWGPEVGYVVRDNLTLIGGFNFTGLTGRGAEDVGDAYTNQGWYVGMRWKFDETLFDTKKPSVNKTLKP